MPTMARAGTTLLFLSAMSTLFIESMPFVVIVKPPLQTQFHSTTSGAKDSKQRTLQHLSHTSCSSGRLEVVGALRADGGASTGGMKDVCRDGGGKTALWHRVAHKNMARIRVNDRLPDVRVR